MTVVVPAASTSGDDRRRTGQLFKTGGRRFVQFGRRCRRTQRHRRHSTGMGKDGALGLLWRPHSPRRNIRPGRGEQYCVRHALCRRRSRRSGDVRSLGKNSCAAGAGCHASLKESIMAELTEQEARTKRRRKPRTPIWCSTRRTTSTTCINVRRRRRGVRHRYRLRDRDRRHATDHGSARRARLYQRGHQSSRQGHSGHGRALPLPHGRETLYRADGDHRLDINIPVGLVVDNVSEVLEIPETQIDQPPHFGGSRDDKSVIRGLGKQGERVAILLDIIVWFPIRPLTCARKSIGCGGLHRPCSY